MSSLATRLKTRSTELDNDLTAKSKKEKKGTDLKKQKR